MSILQNNTPSKPLEPHIDIDGKIICSECHMILKLIDNKCPNCNKDVDWSWFDDGR